MSSSEARRRMKADLQAQLDRTTAQEEEEQYSRHRSYQSQSHIGPSHHATSSSRPDFISPTWSRSQTQAPPQSQSHAHSQRTEWSSLNERRNGSSSRNRNEHTHSQAHPAFQMMPEPTPMITTSVASGSSSAPWQRNGGSSVHSRQTATGTFTPPTPDTPNMPNPLSASFVNVPVPSKHQLHEYLVNKQKQPLGLGMGWSIEGHIFDVYDLFVAVVRLGGSSTVSRREWWPTLAVMLGVPPSINTPQGPRASTEAARQLFAFFSLHLGTLEKMWESTGPNEAFDKTGGARMRLPVSSARGDGEETRNQPSTYPPPPPQHRESSSSDQYNRSHYQPPSAQPSSLPTSMPLHVNPSEGSSSTAGFSLPQPPRKNQPNAKTRQQSSNGVNGTSFTRSQPAQAPSVSPLLHQPVPARLTPEPERTSIDPRLIPIQNSSSTTSSAQAGTQSSNPQPASSSSTAPKSFGMAPLTGYNPPKFASFDHLVATNALTLPKLPSNVVLNISGTESEIYAKRCFELRGVVKKIQAKEQTRQVLKEEMTFWQKLLAILRHNPQVVIPGSQPMSTENVPHVPLPASQPVTDNAVAGPSNGSVPVTGDGQPPDKKRGRKPKAVDPDASASMPMEIGPNGELVPSTQVPPAKRKRATTASAISTEPDIAEPTTASHMVVEGNSSQPPKSRKPYTIRVGPDGTPISDRFKRRLVTGNLGYVEVVRDSQGMVSDHNGLQRDPGPSTLYAAGDDVDAFGEVDPDLDIARFEGPGGLAAFDAAIGYRDEDFEGEPTLSQVGPSGTGSIIAGIVGTSASTSGSAPNSTTKLKNPKMVEASKRRWEKKRQDQAAARLAAGEQPPNGLTTSQPVGVPTSQSTAEPVSQKRGGFAVPGNAVKAANKRWSLQHSALTGSSPSGTSVGVFSPVSSTPMTIASPKRVISLSSGPNRDRESTPMRSMGADLLRHRAGSLKPRSSLPLHLTPSRRAWSPVESQEMTADGGAGDDAPEFQWLPEPTDTRAGQSSSTGRGGHATGKSKAVSNLSKQAKAPRASLPNHLADSRHNGTMGPPLSTDRPTRAEKGKEVDRNQATPEPSRVVQTRREKAAAPEVVIRPSRQSLPSERASSVALSQPSTRGRPIARASLSPVRSSQPPPSQFRHRLIPEIELITPRRYLRLSPVRPVPVKAEVSPIKLEPRTKAKPPPQSKLQPKPKPRPVVTIKTKPKPKRNPVKHVRVVLPIRRRRRANLILMGHYDPFRDDDSDDEGRTKRHGHSGLRPKVALPRGSQARTAKPQAPEIIVSRFVARGVENELDEMYRDVLSESTILKRTSERECGWKGCDALLASEWHMKRHVELRRHAAQGIFKAGIYGETTLYRCHWEDCEQPCFSSLQDLEQHLTARHISRVLACPYPDCDLLFSTLSHLTRHAVKHHDSADDQPVPLADLSQHIPPPPLPNPPQHLPESARTDILTTPLVEGSTFKSSSRQEWCKLKVLNGSYAPDEPVLHIEHPPHILQPLEEGGGDDESEAGSVFTDLNGGIVTEERLLDESLGRPKRRLFPVVNVRVGKRSKAGSADDIVLDDSEAGGEVEVGISDNSGPVEDDVENAEFQDALDVPGDDNSVPPTAEEAPVDLGESAVPQDLISTETAPLAAKETPMELGETAHAPEDPMDTETNPLLAEETPTDLGESVALENRTNTETTPLLAEEIPMDLGESAVLEDPIDTETTYSPLLGPRPDDILFDLSDDEEGEGIGDVSGDVSENEVWAELEDQEMTQAFTPAGMLGDYDMSEDEDGGMDEDEDGGMDEDEDLGVGDDEDVGTEAIRAAILSDPLYDLMRGLESEEAALNGGDEPEDDSPKLQPAENDIVPDLLDTSPIGPDAAVDTLPPDNTDGSVIFERDTSATEALTAVQDQASVSIPSNIEATTIESTTAVSQVEGEVIQDQATGPALPESEVITVEAMSSGTVVEVESTPKEDQPLVMETTTDSVIAETEELESGPPSGMKTESEDAGSSTMVVEEAAKEPEVA